MTENPSPSAILVIDDEPDIRLSLSLVLRKNFRRVECIDHPAKAGEAITRVAPQVILLDMNFSRGMVSGNEGITWLGKILAQHADIPVIMMTAYGDVDLAIRAIKLGAFDFILKPWNNDRLLQITTEAKKFAAGKSNATNGSIRDVIIGKCEALQRVMSIAQKVAKTDANVLLLGENGTGKDLMAQFIHAHSARCDKPMIKVDLGSLSEGLLESELFGHKKGAFTDARTDRVGWFEQANHSTLFLDEIGNISPAAQNRLLQVIQTGKFAPVGSSSFKESNVRLVCATNLNPAELINKGKFRRDLYYRINTVEITLPPLRERGEDKLIIARYFLDVFRKKYNRPELTFSEEGENSIMSYSWPGNIRELQHSIERAVILCDKDSIFPEDLVITDSANEISAVEGLMNLEELEVIAIKKALEVNEGKIASAARDLGLSRASLYRRMDKYGL